jgi:predicted amidohydrolase YtcJ
MPLPPCTTVHRRLRGVAAASLALLLATPALAQPPADMVLRGGNILTVDPKDNVVQAMAISGGRIVALGTDAAIAAYVGPKTEVIELAGRTATPGLIDAHAHALPGALSQLQDLSLDKVTSVAMFLDLVRAKAKTLAAGEWLVGRGWNESVIAEHRAPTLAQIDEAAGDHPVALGSTTGHYTLVNSIVLKRAGIDAKTPDPENGRIGREADGSLSGVVYEHAKDPVIALIPPPSPEMARKALIGFFASAHAEGTTGFKDPRIEPFFWNVYRDLAREGALPMHVCTLLVVGTTMDGARATLADYRKDKAEVAALPGRNLDVCGVKIFLDGSAIGRTAWMNQPYAALPGDSHPDVGLPATDPTIFRAMVNLFTAEGVPIGTHAIGDKAIDATVDAYAAALKATPKTGLRHSIIHAHIPTPHALAVMGDLQRRYDAGYPEAQAEFLWMLGDSLAANFGADRNHRMMPFATYKKAGLIYADSSDYPVVPFPPRYALWASVERRAEGGRFGAQPFGTEEAVDIRTALRSHTLWAARQLFLDKETGSLEPGKLADIAIWDRNPYTVPAADLKDMRCLITLFAGKVVYRAE